MKSLTQPPIRLICGILYAATLAFLFTYVPWTAKGFNDPEGSSQFDFYFGHHWIWNRPNGYAVIEVRELACLVAGSTAVFIAANLFATFLKLRNGQVGAASAPPGKKRILWFLFYAGFIALEIGLIYYKTIRNHQSCIRGLATCQRTPFP